METFVALLRGINVGRGNRVPMAELRTLLARLGYRHAATLLNSGNAVFCASAKADADASHAISQALAEELGVSVPVIVKSAREFSPVLAGIPGFAGEPSRLLVAFAAQPEELTALAALEPLLSSGELLHVTPHAAYLHCPAGVSDSKAADALLGKLGRGVTTRNWATVLKIAAALSSLPPDNSSKPTPPRGAA